MGKTGKRRPSLNRSITVPIQLIIQPHSRAFVSSDSFKQELWVDSIRFEKRYPGPTRSYDEQTTAYFANERGVYYGKDDIDVFPKKFYALIPRSIRNPKLSISDGDAVLTKFIKKHGFCSFPSREEIESMNKEQDYYLEKFTGIRDRTSAMNWLSVERKISTLADIIIRAGKKDLTEGDIQFLFDEKQRNVKDIIIDRSGFAYRETIDAETPFDDVTEFQSMAASSRNIGDRGFTRGYRIFGHVALCCLELLLDIEKQQITRFCENEHCKKPLPIDSHGRRKTCKKEDNPTCHKQVKKQAKRNERAGLQLQKAQKKKKRKEKLARIPS